MSETMPERPTHRGGMFTRKVGPLPVWAWMAVGLVAAIAFYLIQKKNAPAASTAAPSTATGTTASSSIPQFVNQVYTNGSPPAAHNPRGSKPPTQSGGTVIMSLPDGSGGWEQVSFPSQNAYNAWVAWNQSFVQNGNAQATRSQWNTELTSLGVTRTDGQPLAPPSTKTGNPFDAM